MSEDLIKWAAENGILALLLFFVLLRIEKKLEELKTAVNGLKIS